MIPEQLKNDGFRFILLKGKVPVWPEWNSVEKWRDEEFNNVKSFDEIINHNRNVGVLTGQLSGIIAIDVDQPDLIGFNPTKGGDKSG